MSLSRRSFVALAAAAPVGLPVAASFPALAASVDPPEPPVILGFDCGGVKHQFRPSVRPGMGLDQDQGPAAINAQRVRSENWKR